MNKFLQKAAELKTQALPYRRRVEVVIQKGDTVLVTKNKDKETGDAWFGFPGGGIEEQTAEKAAMDECLEEVGIKVKNVKSLGITHTQEGMMSKKEGRNEKYRGSITTWYSADYVEVDRSKLGDDGDSRQYSWEGLSEAQEAVSKSKVMATPRVKALRALKAVKSVEPKTDKV